tara:strand:- start:1415 stop:1711 length:297 start_codon:yes stop_codon:yes gene_type:complete
MKKTVNFYEFRDWFWNRPNNFTNDGLVALWEMLQEYEDGTGEEIEFDPISLCCEYSEYENMEEFWLEYDKEDYPNEESIMDATFYWAFGDGSFIIQKF